MVKGTGLPIVRHHRFGWKRDRNDPRDRKFAAPRAIVDALPDAVDLTTTGLLAFPIYDQGSLGSCTANAGGAADQYDQIVEALAGVTNPTTAQVQAAIGASYTPSRLFLYFGERQIEGTIPTDSGAEPRDCMTVLANFGAPPEIDWPYDVSQFAVSPPAKAYADGLNRKAIQYESVAPDLQDMCACIASGYPFTFGFTCFEQLESQQCAGNGVVTMPRRFFSRPIGGHDVLIVGYSMATQMFKFRNSWGNWGDGGYGYIPFAYATDQNLASDFWKLQTIDTLTRH